MLIKECLIMFNLLDFKSLSLHLCIIIIIVVTAPAVNFLLMKVVLKFEEWTNYFSFVVNFSLTICFHFLNSLLILTNFYQY